MATIHAPGQDLKLDIDPFRLLLLSLKGDCVRTALARRFSQVPAFEAWATQFPMETPAASALRSLALWVAAELEHETSPLATKPRTIAAVERCLLGLFLDVLEARCGFGRRGKEDLTETHVRRIEAWIEANLTEPIGVEEMAGLAGVSSRSVQTAFRRAHGCTPMQYVQRRRLELARQFLQTPTPDTTVTGAALDCGLYHLGRFAAAYSALFGEKPSETLARGRRGAAA
jgi:AraC-like DNA-binding protein